MSILSALKKKFNAKGGSIEEAIKTMEVSGGSGGSLRINITQEVDGDTTTYKMDKTWQEIYDAFVNGSDCYAYQFAENIAISRYNVKNVTFAFGYGIKTDGFDNNAFTANTPNDYPSYSSGGR